MTANIIYPPAAPKVLDAFLSQKLRFWSLAAMVCLVYVHAFNLHPRYLEPWTQVREPLSWGNGLQYFLANGLLRFRIPILFAISGYLLARSDGREPHRQRVRRRLRTLGLPYLLLMLPVPQVQQHALPYPLGTADFAQLTGRPFSLTQYQAVLQFFYMGALDDNDAATYDDAYDDGERQLIYRYLGQRMQPDRWAFCQQVYRQQHVQATFKTYPGIGHGTDMTIYRDLVAFFQAHQ